MELSQCIQPMTFAPMEPISLAWTLYILRRGIAAKLGMPLPKGSVWGHDFVCKDKSLVSPYVASALTYVEVLCLSHQSLYSLLSSGDYENEALLCRRAGSFYAVRAKLATFGREAIRAKGTGQKVQPGKLFGETMLD